MRALLALLLVFTVGCAHTQSTAERFSLGCLGADLGTTAIGLYAKDFEESNPLFHSDDEFEQAELLFINAGVSVGINYLLRYIVNKTDSNPWWAFGPYGAIRCGSAAYNLKLIIEDEIDARRD
jgi:hypothetical protein